MQIKIVVGETRMTYSTGDGHEVASGVIQSVNLAGVDLKTGRNEIVGYHLRGDDGRPVFVYDDAVVRVQSGHRVIEVATVEEIIHHQLVAAGAAFAAEMSL